MLAWQDWWHEQYSCGSNRMNKSLTYRGSSSQLTWPGAPFHQKAGRSPHEHALQTHEALSCCSRHYRMWYGQPGYTMWVRLREEQQTSSLANLARDTKPLNNLEQCLTKPNAVARTIETSEADESCPHDPVGRIRLVNPMSSDRIVRINVCSLPCIARETDFATGSITL